VVGWQAGRQADNSQHQLLHAQLQASAHLLPTPPTLRLACSAGDQYTGTAWDSIYTQKGNYSVAELVNMLQFDAMVRALSQRLRPT
jgi:hypothetical protein